MQGLEQLAIRSANDLAALREEWDSLAERCPDYLLSQTHRWAEVAWQTVAQPNGRTLDGVALRFDGRLVAAWPLVTYRKYGLRIVRPLGSETTEYCAPLVEAGEHRAHWTAVLWKAAARSADLVLLPFLSDNSPLADVVRLDGRRTLIDGVTRAPYVARGDHLDWSSYQATVSTSRRKRLRQMRRRLDKLGKVTFERQSAERAAGLIDWLLGHKKRWLVRRNLENDWLDRADYRNFLFALVSTPGPLGDMAMFVLKLDGVPVAAQLSSVDRSRVEFYIGGFDDQWASYSPGEILIEDCLRWAFEHDLDFDFRVGDEPYKSSWAKQSREIVSLRVATSTRAVPMVELLRIREFLKWVRFKLGLGRLLRRAVRVCLGSGTPE